MMSYNSWKTLQNIDAAKERLHGEWRGTRYHFFAGETGEWHSVTKAEVSVLGGMIRTNTPDAYNHWCAETQSRIVSSRH